MNSWDLSAKVFVWYNLTWKKHDWEKIYSSIFGYIRGGIMRNISVRDIVDKLGGTLYGSLDAEFSGVYIDTRKVQPGSLYMGFKGEKVDGNELYAEAFSKGATVCVVEREPDSVPEGCAVIRVSSTYRAILDLSFYYRRSLRVKVIGITGSTGKTSTKDILHGMLSKRYKVFKTTGNFNNEIGLPLMIFSLDETYDYAILEMGMSAPLEIHNLARVANPDIAIITNIGLSHIESLGSQENILKAKMEITDFFNQNSLLILNGDDEYLGSIKEKPYRIARGGISRGDMIAKIKELSSDHVSFTVNGKDIIEVGIPGRHNVQNAVLCYIAAKELGISDEDLRFVDVMKSSMRMDLVRMKSLTVINDCYNASPDSMKAGIDYLISFEGRKVAILGTMRELGQESGESHRRVGKFAHDKGVKCLIAVGEYEKEFREGFGDEGFHGFATFEEAIAELNGLLEESDIVLLKASRGMNFERFLPVLEEFGGK
jgi:UDP-N-acetylmuramoyl-tripeptide--D-alanyl-D-alanine ligase